MNTWQILSVVNATFPGYIPERRVGEPAKKEEQYNSRKIPSHYRSLEKFYHAPFDREKIASKSELSSLLRVSIHCTGTRSNTDLSAMSRYANLNDRGCK